MSWRSNNERRRLELAEAIRERPLISRTLTMPNGRRTTIDADSFAEFNELLELAEALAAGGGWGGIGDGRVSGDARRPTRR